MWLGFKTCQHINISQHAAVSIQRNPIEDYDDGLQKQKSSILTV